MRTADRRIGCSSEKDTLQALYDGASSYEKCAIAAAVTTDEQGVINYPYLHALGKEGQVYAEKKHCSFCCSLLTRSFAGFRFSQSGCLKELV